jgi:tetratricopeptide (TPR) repeat protein
MGGFFSRIDCWVGAFKMGGKLHNTIRRDDGSVRAPSPLSLAELLCKSGDNDLSRDDIALNNLTCAIGLPGAEDLSVPKYLRRLDALVNFVRRETERDLDQFRRTPGRFSEFDGRTEALFRAASLVTLLRNECGLQYNPVLTRRDDLCILGYADCGDLLINGLLSDRRTGTCNSIPVLIVAIGRRLGYPLYVSANRHHVFARWDGVGPGSPPEGERFNIEASNSGGMDSNSDEHYRDFPCPMAPWERDSGYYLRSFTSADELALAFFSRAWVLETHGRFEESLPAWAKCCTLAPTEPCYPRRAINVLLDAMYLRCYGKVMIRRGQERRPVTAPPERDPRDLFPPNLAALAYSIHGHNDEVNGRLGNALRAYRVACELDPDSKDHPADLDRLRRRLEEAAAATARKAVSIIKARSINMPDHSMKTPRTPLSVPSLGAGKPKRANAPVPNLSELIGAPFRLKYEAEGLSAEQAGRLAEAQALYARASEYAPHGGPHPCRAYLARSVRKEVLSGSAPVAFAAGATAEKHQLDDPRLRLPPQVQAVIWAERGRAYEGLQRFNDAVLAYSQAQKLSPGNRQYPVDVHRAATMDGAARQPARNTTFSTVTFAAPPNGDPIVWSPQFMMAAGMRPPAASRSPKETRR